MREAIIMYRDGKMKTIKVEGALDIPNIKITPEIVSITCIGRRGDYLMVITNA